MRLPSLWNLVRRTADTARRFPMTLVAALVAAGIMLLMVEGPSNDWMGRLWATAATGLAGFTAVATAGERLEISTSRRWLLDLGLTGALVLLFVTSLTWTDRMATLRFVQIMLAAHLAVAVLPFVRMNRGHGFWQFNRFLFLRYLLASFFALVLWIGLAVALLAVDKLLGIDVPGKWYPHLAVLLGYVFHPLFFLAGVPADYRGLDELDEYPVGLKVFTQFVLIPLVTVYLAILTLYLGRVLVTRTWPSGWIGYLVSSVSAVGVLALLLVHPIRERADSRWVNRYGRWLFVALLPSLVMLVVAVGKRIGQYGITEPRYFLVVLAGWLAGLALFYGGTASRNIKVIPATLGAFAVLTAFGPWGAYAVGERSQAKRFRAILAANGIRPAARMGGASASVAVTDRRELAAIIHYLQSVHGPAAVGRVLGVPRDTVLAWRADAVGGGGDQVERHAMTRLGLTYVGRWSGTDARPIWLSSNPIGVVDVAGYEFLHQFNLPPDNRFLVGADSIVLVPNATNDSLVVIRGRDSLLRIDLGTPIRAAAGDQRDGSGRALAEPIVIDAAAGLVAIRLVLQTVSANLADSVLTVTSMTGLVLVRGLGSR